MISSKDYWAARERAQQEANKKLDAKFDKELKKIYDAALINIRQEIDAFYGRYATKEGISLAEAKKRVSQADIKAYEAKAKEYVANRTFTEQANEEMRLYNLTMKVNRLEMLKSRIGMELAAKYSDMERKAAKHLQSGAEDEFKRMAGILGKSVPDVKKAASTIPGASFHNATYSERIWTNQRALKSEIDKLLQEGMIQGRNPRAIAPQLQRAFGVSKVASERLMRTEMCRVQIEAQRQSYDENGIDEFEYMAHAGCCEICAGMNGKVFKVKKMIVGDNAPPMHPNCRCGTVPHMDREEFNKWLNEEPKKDTVSEGTKSPKALRSQAENGIINIKIDKFVPCLEDAKTGEILDTESKKITDKRELKGLTKNNGWYINWAKEIDAGRQVYGLYLKGDDKLQGLCAFDIDKQNYAVCGNWIVAAPHNRGKNKQYNGVGGHLFAIMGQKSVEAGYGGFFYGKAANKKLLEHYEKKMGAQEFPGPEPYSFQIDEVAMEKILKKYNFEWRK